MLQLDELPKNTLQHSNDRLDLQLTLFVRIGTLKMFLLDQEEMILNLAILSVLTLRL